MHQMCLQRIAFAIDAVLAGRVKVQLLKLEAEAIHLKHTAGRKIKLHRMAIVNHAGCRRAIGQCQWRQRCIDNGSNIDRRLVFTVTAGGKLWRQLAPI